MAARPVGTVAGAWANAVPGVVKLVRRALNAVSSGMFVTALVVLLGLPPSQLISRRPEGNVPTLGLRVPRVLRKLSTVVWMAAALAPEAEKMMGSARAGADRADSSRQASAA